MQMLLRNGLRKYYHDDTWVRVVHVGYFDHLEWSKWVNYKAGDTEKVHIIEMKHEWFHL